MTVAALDPDSAADADVAAMHAVHIAAMTVDSPEDPPPPLEERPDVAALTTGNSATNAQMLRINDRLGFRPWSEVRGWQCEVGELVSRLG